MGVDPVGRNRWRYLPGDLGRLLREEFELARIVIGLWRNRLIVATNLGVVVVLELERELHQGVSDVSGGFIGEGEVVLLLGAGLFWQPNGWGW